MGVVQKFSLKAVSLSLLLTLETLSCSSVQGAPPTDPVKPKTSNTAGRQLMAAETVVNGANSTEPAKVQLAFQEEFARQLAKAGPKAEGWALFSESSMSHNGQRWIIKSKSGKKEIIKHCLIEQGQNACVESSLTRASFTKIEPSLRAADKLQHILPVVFDGLRFEYLHAVRGNPQTKRVVFVSSHKPFPEAYQNLIKAFSLETSKKN